MAATPIPQENTNKSDNSRQAEVRRQAALRRLEQQRAEAAQRQEATRRQGAQEEEERRRADLESRERERIATARRVAEANVESPTVRQAEAAAKRALPVRATIGRVGVADLRKALILQEIVGPPVAARDPGQNPGVSW